MRSPKILIPLLLLVNLVLLAFLMGWIPAFSPTSEHQRLQAQIKPEAIRLIQPENLPPVQTQRPTQPTIMDFPPIEAKPTTTKAAPEPEESKAPPVCTQITELNQADADAMLAQARAASSKIKAKLTDNAKPSTWWVRIAPTGSKMAAEKRVAELKEKDISEYFIVQEAGANQYAISLGLFKNETSAQTHLANIKLKGIHDAAIVPRNSPTGVSIELRATPDLMKPLLKELKRKYRNARHTPCK